MATPTCSTNSVCPVKRLCMSRSASVRQGLPHAVHFMTLICVAATPVLGITG